MTIRILAVMLIGAAAARAAEGEFAEKFEVAPERFVSSGRTPLVILEPGRSLEYAGEERGVTVKLVVTVTEQTRRLDGVETRVVVEQRSSGGRVIETSKRYLAIDRQTKDVYCFGRDVSTYTTEQFEGHEGSWHAGAEGAKFAMAMPAKVKAGQRFQCELAPKVAMGRVEIVSIAEQKRVPAGAFEKCVLTKETSALDANASGSRVFAPGVGMIADGKLELVKLPKAVAAKDAKPLADAPLIPIEDARAALDLVGADPAAEAVWAEAINDPNLTAHQRSDLIEDLNENGFPDPQNVTADDLPLVVSRLQLIEQLAPDAMDQVNADAFAEAYKDLSNMFDKLTRE